MIFNQQTLLLYGTENSEQKTMILIQGKRAIYFKYFCIMHIYNAIRNKQGNEFAIVHTFQESIKINILKVQLT